MRTGAAHRAAGLLIATLIAGGSAMAETVNFDSYSPGTLPSPWICGTTGSGTSRWAVEPDAAAPGKPNVVRQSGVGDYPFCALKSASLTDGFVQVKFKALSGRRDQAAGVMWRWKDGDNFYVARANALENNVSLYYTTNGRRSTIQYVDVPVAKNTWHTLRVDFNGRSIQVALNGKVYIDVQDTRITGAGAVGMWTKADSVMVFDDFAYSAAESR